MAEVVVVGAGTAALASAASAAVHGAERVTVLEAAPPELSGGNARLSHAGFRCTYSDRDDVAGLLTEHEGFDGSEFEAYSVEDFRDDFRRCSGDFLDEEITGLVASGSAEALRWLRDLGVPISLNRHVVVGGRSWYEPGLALQLGTGSEGGATVLECWRAICRGLGVRIEYGRRVGDLVLRDGRVEGVEVELGGRVTRYAASSVILCSGGFQADRRWLVDELGPFADRLRIRGSAFDEGVPLAAALRAGAVRWGDWSGAIISPVDHAAGDVGAGNAANRYSYNLGVMLNREGRRFTDEGSGLVAETYGWIGRMIAEQLDGWALQIFDAQTFPFLKHYAYGLGEVRPFASLEELAEAHGLDVAAVRTTIDGFNAACPDRGRFDPSRVDGCGTTGIHPPKSAWAVPLDRPPFYAFPVAGGIGFTLGGLRVDRSARVLRPDGDPIPGLLAAGDVVGLFSRSYPSGSGQTRNAVLGRIAGRTAATVR